MGFVGGGNMARALIGGLLAGDWCESEISVADPSSDQLGAIQQRWSGIYLTTDNLELLARCDLLVLAVKPQVLSDCLRAMSAHLPNSPPLMLSIVAGIRIATIQRWLGRDLPVVRCMPNTPALIGCGAAGLAASANVEESGRRLAEKMLSAVGIALWVSQESDLDAVTALSGSGPAYIFYMIEAMEDAGIALGLDRGVARRLALQTTLGAARLAATGEADPGELRARVTSKGGTTARALEVMMKADFKTLIGDALAAAAVRAQQLADEAESNA